MKKNVINILLVLFLCTGVGLMLYPTVANWWNGKHQSYAVASYVEAVKQEGFDYESIRQKAIEYNQNLAEKDNRWAVEEEEQEEYESMLIVGDGDVIGCIEIPKIDVLLPIYHGTDESVLQAGAGHLEGTSLPIGGKTTHSVISAHRGLPSSKLFTDLDQMENGDVFMIHVLGETLTYEVDRILVVRPKEIEALDIEEGKDYCTLLTCTPYGINTHRILVRGHRIENIVEVIEESELVTDKPVKSVIEIYAIPIIMIIILMLSILIVFLVRRKKRKNEDRN